MNADCWIRSWESGGQRAATRFWSGAEDSTPSCAMELREDPAVLQLSFSDQVYSGVQGPLVLAGEDDVGSIEPGHLGHLVVHVTPAGCKIERSRRLPVALAVCHDVGAVKVRSRQGPGVLGAVSGLCLTGM
ncbi:hypothetical protein EYF80_042517 [Liparis tanakae]|uniref:Uncharacterized protein n=1 Tax=Liparis tanakae TaxID=230148 RepID=A0A4Z2G194_9TELE|nr:hypothetical protein EYF80_042517 [Liparis tanakae]